MTEAGCRFAFVLLPQSEDEECRSQCRLVGGDGSCLSQHVRVFSLSGTRGSLQVLPGACELAGGRTTVSTLDPPWSPAAAAADAAASGSGQPQLWHSIAS